MKLETGLDFLERIRAKHGASWYRLAKIMEVHENTVGNWRHGRTGVDKRFAARIAQLLDEAPEYVLACLEAERDQPNLQLWEKIAAKFRAHAASILLGGLGLAGALCPPHTEPYAKPAGSSSPVMYIMLNY